MDWPGNPRHLCTFDTLMGSLSLHLDMDCLLHIKFLGYNPNQPPPYHGAPKLLYIPGPAIFNPRVFAALLHYEKPDTHHNQEELLSNGLPVSEVAYKGK
jgi:hypothetical protein